MDVFGSDAVVVLLAVVVLSVAVEGDVVLVDVVVVVVNVVNGVTVVAFLGLRVGLIFFSIALLKNDFVVSLWSSSVPSEVRDSAFVNAVGNMVNAFGDVKILTN